MTSLVSSALLSTQSDERLVALTRDGSERAFEAIVERYRRPLHRYLRRLLPPERVEDVLQQTFLGAWSGLRDGSPVRELRPWLYRIAHNAAVNALARAGYDYEELRDSLRGSEGSDSDVERRTVIRETLASVAGLPDRQRRALLETAVQGRPTAEVAHEMGLSEGAFRQLVHRARATLRAAATAVTPMPAAAWAAGAGGAGDGAGGLAVRVAELAAGAGAGGAGAALLKTGAVVGTAGAIAAGPAGLLPVRDGARLSERDTTSRAAEPHRGGSPPAKIGAVGGARAASHAGSGRRGGDDTGRSDRRGRGGGADDAPERGADDRREGGGKQPDRGASSDNGASGTGSSQDGSGSGAGSAGRSAGREGQGGGSGSASSGSSFSGGGSGSGSSGSSRPGSSSSSGSGSSGSGPSGDGSSGGGSSEGDGD